MQSPPLYRKPIEKTFSRHSSLGMGIESQSSALSGGVQSTSTCTKHVSPGMYWVEGVILGTELDGIVGTAVVVTRAGWSDGFVVALGLLVFPKRLGANVTGAGVLGGIG